MSLRIIALIDFSNRREKIQVPISLNISLHQLQIVNTLSIRPLTVSQLSKILTKHPWTIYKSLKSLTSRNIVKPTIYLSPINMGKASLRKYYVLNNNIITCNGPTRKYTRKQLEQIFKRDDEEILRQIKIANAKLMMMSPNPIKQAKGRELLKQLTTQTE